MALTRAMPLTPAEQPSIVRWLPVAVSVIALATAGPLAWSRDFGIFLLTVSCFLPVLAILCVILAGWAIVERGPNRRQVRLALALIVILPPLTFVGIFKFKDSMEFFLWYSTHRELAARYANRDAIIADWESWGMAGMENDSYLVSSAADRLDQPSEQRKWLGAVGSDCELADTKRLMRQFYIVTTYNCPLR